MAVTFTGGSALPAVGSAAYTAAQNGSGTGTFNPTTGILTTTPTTSTPTIPNATVTPATTGTTAPVGSTPITSGGTTYNATPNAPAVSAGTGTTAASPNASGPNGVSSSASLTTAAGANTAVNNATGGTAATTAATVASIASSYSSLYGTTINPSDIQAIMTANPDMTVGQAAEQAATVAQGRDETAAATAQEQATTTAATNLANEQEANQTAMYNADLAAQNAQYATASSTLQTQQQQSLGTATASLAALGDTVANSSSAQGMLAGINSAYAVADANLQSQAIQAKAALDQGNANAYNQIQTDMANTIAGAQTAAQNIINGVTSQNITAATTANTQANQTATLADNAQSKAASQYNTGLSTLTTDSPVASLFDPTTGQPVAGALTSDAFTSSSIYQQGVAAGYSPAAILGDAQNAVKTSKAAATQNTLQTNLLRAQIEEANSATAANSKILNGAVTSAITGTSGTTANDGTTIDGNAYNNAISSIATNGKLTIAQTNAVAGAVQTALASGDTTQAKNLVKTAVESVLPSNERTTVQSVDTIGNVVPQLKSAILALPADQQIGVINGNINNLLNKVGVTNKPQLLAVQGLLNHVSGLYVADVFGKRAVTSNSGNLLSLFPTGSDSVPVAMADLDGLQATANDYVQGTMESIIDPSTYNSIFNSSTTNTNSGTNSTSSPNDAYSGINSSVMNMVNALWNNSTTTSQ